MKFSEKLIKLANKIANIDPEEARIFSEEDIEEMIETAREKRNEKMVERLERQLRRMRSPHLPKTKKVFPPETEIYPPRKPHEKYPEGTPLGEIPIRDQSPEDLEEIRDLLRKKNR